MLSQSHSESSRKAPGRVPSQIFRGKGTHDTCLSDRILMSPDLAQRGAGRVFPGVWAELSGTRSVGQANKLSLSGLHAVPRACDAAESFASSMSSFCMERVEASHPSSVLVEAQSSERGHAEGLQGSCLHCLPARGPSVAVGMPLSQESPGRAGVCSPV